MAPMRVVYEPENIIDAHVVKGVLESVGIPVYLRGEYLAGGIGELPVSGFLALCVHEVFEQQARDVLADLESDRALGSVESEETYDFGWAGAQQG
jgi:Putative prokaryotic signal transducing protein